MRTLIAATLALSACSGDDAPPVEPAPDADADVDTDTEPVPTPDDLDADGFPRATDCDDTDPTVFPGAPEHCDGRHTDCDGTGNDDGLVTVDGGTTFRDLQEALSAAAPGSEVRLCRGTWSGPFTSTAPVAIVGQDGSGAVILTASDPRSVLSLVGDSSVAGVTVRGGRADEGGGIRVTTPGAFTLADAVVTGNVARLAGGGVWLADGVTASFPGTWILGNEATRGGGIAGGADVSLDLAGAVVDTNTAAAGGGVYLPSGTITAGLVSNNVATPDPLAAGPDPNGGAGLWTSGPTTVTGTELRGNTVGQFELLDRQGGGIAIVGGDVSLVDVSVHGNAADEGGGLWVERGSVSLEGASAVWDNTAGLGSGIYALRASVTGGTVWGNSGRIAVVLWEDGTLDGVLIRANLGSGVWGYGSATIRGCTVDGNIGSYDPAGIALLTNESPGVQPHIEIVDTVVTHNVSLVAGGGISLYANDFPASIVGATITDNVAPDGAGIDLDAGRLTLEGTSVLRNVATGEGGGIRVASGARLDATDCDLGAAADDNTPDDVATSRASIAGYGAGATFTCTGSGCDPLPGGL